jgi:hypothetical protein
MANKLGELFFVVIHVISTPTYSIILACAYLATLGR